MSPMRVDWIQKRWKTIVVLLICVGIAVTALATFPRWKPYAYSFADYLRNRNAVEHEDDHEDHLDHVDAVDSIKPSPVAWKNIGLRTGVVIPSDHVRTVSVPAIVVERPGRSQIQIAAPMTGIVTQVYPVERESIEPGQPLFDLRLTHEDVVSKQSEFLTQLQNADVLQKELKRLQDIGEGVIPGKRIIEQQYELDKVTSQLGSIKQSLLLHGMTDQQIEQIEATRKLVQSTTVVAPPYAENHEHLDALHQYHVQKIQVDRGQSVTAGQLMGILADHCLLYVEGQAFEDDALRLVEAAKEEKTIAVKPLTGSRQSSEAMDLEIQSVADQVESQSRALKFYLLLPNQPTETSASSSPEFVSWKYRPGQRMEAHVPTTDVLRNKIVLPPSAVAIDGINAFVFEQNGDHFDRIDVHVLFRDKNVVVLENDGKLAGATIALSGAYEMHLELKNQAGGAVDPHAGHSH
jgi:membrane fusion protein, heavy metal efflux system